MNCFINRKKNSTFTLTWVFFFFFCTSVLSCSQVKKANTFPTSAGFQNQGQTTELFRFDCDRGNCPIVFAVMAPNNSKRTLNIFSGKPLPILQWVMRVNSLLSPPLQALWLCGSQAGKHDGQRQPPLCRAGARAAGHRHRQLCLQDDRLAKTMRGWRPPALARFPSNFFGCFSATSCSRLPLVFFRASCAFFFFVLLFC